MTVTISTHNGTTISFKHNRRDKDFMDKERQNEIKAGKEPHVRENGHFEVLYDKDIKEVYQKLFGTAVDKYNAKQTRKDRKIDNYYNKIKNDKQKHVCYEMIIGIYGEDLDTKTKEDIMQKYIDGWRKSNPNLEPVGIYYHDDETNPHIHIDYIPVHHKDKGLEVENSLTGALGEMGFKTKGAVSAQMQWERRENERLESICNEYGLEVDHPTRGTKTEHYKTEIYKLQKEVNELKTSIFEMTNELTEVQIEKDDLEVEVERLKTEKATLTEDNKVLEKDNKDLLNKNTDLLSKNNTLMHAIERLKKWFLTINKRVNELMDFYKIDKKDRDNIESVLDGLKKFFVNYENERNQNIGYDDDLEEEYPW